MELRGQTAEQEYGRQALVRAYAARRTPVRLSPAVTPVKDERPR